MYSNWFGVGIHWVALLYAREAYTGALLYVPVFCFGRVLMIIHIKVKLSSNKVSLLYMYSIHTT